MSKIFLPLILTLFYACNETENKTQNAANESAQLNAVAVKYVRLGLSVGEYDKDFVDAYYGPDSLKPNSTAGTIFPKDSFLAAVDNLANELKKFSTSTNDTIAKRALWMSSQVKAFETRIKVYGGDSASFENETKDLYGVTVPVYDSNHFKKLISSLDHLLKGKGSVNDRFQQLAANFIIPPDKLDTVLKASLTECRKRTLQHYQLPAGENFTLEYVTNKPWSGYNWYKGKYKSVIQINTDIKILIDRVIDVGGHESYPGHHVYNMLQEKNLYRDKGWVETTLYPLYSPQSVIAEGTANFGIALAFPGDEKINLAKNVLLPLAGLDTTGIFIYFKALELKDELNYARNEACRGLLNKTMTEPQAQYWLENFALMSKEAAKKAINFIRDNRSYLITYNYGKDLVKNYVISKAGNDTSKQRELLSWLMSNQVRPADLK
ncbi:MAG: hypothetical protein QM791_09205 [Ferruginibacter sp.]